MMMTRGQLSLALGVTFAPETMGRRALSKPDVSPD